MKPPDFGISFAACKRFARAAYEIIKSVLNNLGVWLLSVLGTLVAPCLPLGTEWLRNGKFDPENLILTAAVLAVGFALTAGHSLTLFSHLTSFIVSLVLGTATGPASPIGLDRWSGTLLTAVGLVHAMERFAWHVVLSRPFPDGFLLNRKKHRSGGGDV